MGYDGVNAHRLGQPSAELIQRSGRPDSASLTSFGRELRIPLKLLRLYLSEHVTVGDPVVE